MRTCDVMQGGSCNWGDADFSLMSMQNVENDSERG